MFFFVFLFRRQKRRSFSKSIQEHKEFYGTIMAFVNEQLLYVEAQKLVTKIELISIRMEQVVMYGDVDTKHELELSM